METSSLQMEEKEHMDKIRDLHINYRIQIQELQERYRQNERTIQEMDQICREKMRESLRLHEKIIRLEREQVIYSSSCFFISSPFNISLLSKAIKG